MNWDDRLTPLGIKHQANSSGQWELSGAHYQDEQEAQGQHHIWFMVVDEMGTPRANVPVFVDWVGRDPEDPPTRRLTDANGKANVDIYANLDVTKRNGPYFAFVEEQGKSDIVRGMGLPEHHHVNFVLTFAPRAATPVPHPEEGSTPTPSPEPAPTPQTVEQAIMAKAQSVPWMPVNNGAALWNFAKAIGLQDQQTDELSATYNGQEYLFQVFNLGIVYCRKGDWGNIKVIRK